jgi:serine/threonine protein kinase
MLSIYELGVTSWDEKDKKGGGPPPDIADGSLHGLVSNFWPRADGEAAGNVARTVNCFFQEKRKQIMNDIRGLSDVSNPSLVQFIGAYRVPDKSQVSIVMEYLDGGSLADLVKQVSPLPFARPHLVAIQ